VSIRPADYSWRIEVLRSPEPSVAETFAEENAVADRELMEELKRRMAYQYPYLDYSALPSKLAASQLSHGRIQRENVAVARPAFLSEGGLTPAERGTALHTFMQFAHYSAAAADASAEVERLVNQGFLTKQQGKAISISRVNRFFRGDLYARMAKADRCLREVHFTIDMPAAVLLERPAKADGSEDEKLVVQGIADCVFEEKDGLTVVDYKTDRVKTPEELIERYREQLRFYKTALERTLGMPVRDCLLYSFHMNATVDAMAAVTASDDE
jgi:ATP-dependent helicase/nuclease subunit A